MASSANAPAFRRHGGAESQNLTTAQAVEKAIKLAQDAVKEDESGNIEEAITMYQESVALIKLGLQVQSKNEMVDTTVLHKYSQLYSERIAELERSLVEEQQQDMHGDAGVDDSNGSSIFSLGSAGPGGGSGGPSSSSSGGSAPGFFSFDDADIKGATPPVPPPTGPNAWRRPFWLIRILRQSMEHGGYLSPDGRVFVPRRVWLQKGARFTAMSAKLECAQCLLAELNRLSACNYKQPPSFAKELEKLDEMLDGMQNSLHRLLPFVPEPRSTREVEASKGIANLTDRLKGGLKLLDKTAARLGNLPAKCDDPAEYVSTLCEVFAACEGLETWIEHYAKLGNGDLLLSKLTAGPASGSGSGPQASGPVIFERLHRCAVFLYEVVCAFVIHDLDGLLQRHMRKASAAFLKGTE